MFYVYQLTDPRNNQPFYIGKGTGNRAKTHLLEIPDTRNVYKENKIAAIRREGLEPKIEYIAENISDEKIAYNIEAELIKKYGRKGYDTGGILTNICPDARPPNHKGRSYEQIYGPERALIERKKRADIQLSRGGYGPEKHTEETKQKIKNKANEARLTAKFSESVILNYGREFCSYFGNIISQKKWLWWAKEHNLPANILRSYRFNGKNLLCVFVEKLKANIKQDSLLWFHDPITYKTFRCSDWELYKNIVKAPDGYIRGRGKINWLNGEITSDQSKILLNKENKIAAIRRERLEQYVI